MAHPMLGKAKSSLRARLRRLGVSAGKSHGASNMYRKKSLPKKNAGRDVGFTIPGGKAKGRADRLANGGAVGKRRGHHTTNIVISAPGGRAGAGPGNPMLRPGGGAPVVQHVHRHVVSPPVGGVRPGLPPIGAAAAPIGAPGLARPPLPVGAGAPPIGGGVLPPRPPIGPPPIGGMKRGGHVKKRKIGGDSPGKGYEGYPHSPTTEAGARDAVSARKRGGVAQSKFANGGDTDTGADEDTTKPPNMKRGGKTKSVKKRQFGGAMAGGAAPPQQPPGFLGMPMPGRAPMPAQQGAPNISGRPARPAQPLTVPMPPTLASMRARPAPGTTTAFKRGGKAKEGHADEAEDKKLFKRMYKEEEKKEAKSEKRKRGGSVSREQGHSVLGAVHSNQHIAKPPSKSVVKGHTALPGEKYKDWGKGSRGVKSRKRGGAVDRVPHTLPGEKYHQQGTGYRARGGSIGSEEAGAGSGLGRLHKLKAAAKVPDHTEA